MSGQRASVCRANAEDKKTFLAKRYAYMVSVAITKLGKTDLVFVQPGAKINSVYYCGWLHGTVVGRRSLTGELSRSCARPAADW